ncbi:MAG: tetratricopeptide repeat protein [Silvanigrellaceae bacterium]|nr:tetratricopeptide repeat protein [Silvanigrellaceae bacterium]
MSVEGEKKTLQTILIVDENHANSLFWEMTLREAFSESKVFVCKTGIEGYDLSLKENISFFIASWEMSTMNGFVFMQKVRKINKYKYTPFLIFSSLLKDEDLILAEEFDIDNYILKPFTKDKIIDKAIEMIQKEININPILKSIRNVEMMFKKNHNNDALILMQKCLKPGPYLLKGLILNATIYSKLGIQFERAEKYYKEALNLNPNSIAALNGLGKLYLKAKNFNEAVKIFEDLHKKIPGNLGRMLDLGNAYLENGSEDKAVELFLQAKKLDSEEHEATAGLGKVAFKRGQMELAQKFFKESGKGDELASYFNNMGIGLVNENRQNDALILYKKAIDVLPEKDKIHLLEFNIGLAHKKLNNYNKASEAFARSILCCPSYEKAYYAMLTCIKKAQSRNQVINTLIINQAAETFENFKNKDDRALS